MQAALYTAAVWIIYARIMVQDYYSSMYSVKDWGIYQMRTKQSEPELIRQRQLGVYVREYRIQRWPFIVMTSLPVYKLYTLMHVCFFVEHAAQTLLPIKITRKHPSFSDYSLYTKSLGIQHTPLFLKNFSRLTFPTLISCSFSTCYPCMRSRYVGSNISSQNKFCGQSASS